MFEFYKMFYKRALSLEDLKEACKWECITKEEFKTITGEEYTE
ncbi:XkdX family protein [Clostridiaceae bacterium 14S0207]|nr:XkdX family protein [Clostridiaceae bacterium 14S0207]